MLTLSLLAIIQQQWIAWSCSWGSSISISPVETTTIFFPQLIQPFTKSTLQQVVNRLAKTKTWTMNGMIHFYFQNAKQALKKIKINPELLLTSVFILKQHKVVMLCFSQTWLSIGLLSHYGQANVGAPILQLCLVYHYDRQHGFASEGNCPVEM